MYIDEVTNTTIRDHEIRTNEWMFSRLSKELYTWFGNSLVLLKLF